MKQSIPTPEGVSIEVELAGLGSRALALVMDSIVEFTLLVLLMVFAEVGLLFVTPDFVEDFAGGFMLGFAALGFLLLHWGISVFMDGASPGKRTLGLRVIGADGQPASAWQLLLRSFALVIDLTLSVGAILIFFSPRPRRLGDLVAGTIVVRESHDDLLLDPWLKSS
ncbi:MAG: RDD family protein, partial [Planctomycetes bacterium]|nr:RDD family protein [Planctomycetota bacterium]